MSESSGALKQKAPYLPFSLEEIACVKTLEDWTNKKAKVVGRLVEVDLATGQGRLVGVGEGIKARILVSLKGVLKVGSDVGRGEVVQLLGELEVWRSEPVLMVHILRRVPSLDCEAYYRAVCRVQSYLPVNVAR